MLLRFDSAKLFVGIFLGVVLLLPMHFGDLRVRNEVVFLVAVTSSALYGLCAQLRLRDSRAAFLVFSIGASISFLLVLLANLPIQVVAKDIAEPLKPLLYSFIFVAGYRLSSVYGPTQAARFIVIVALVSIAFSALIYFPIAHPLVDIYKGRQSIADYNFHFFRFSGTLGYPGGFGYWLCFVVVLCFSLYFQRIISFVKFAVLVAVLLAGLFLTGSRGALVTLFLSLAVFLSVNVTSYKTVIAAIVIGTSLMVFALVLSLQDHVAVQHIVAGLDDPTGGTFRHRLTELELLGRVFSEGHIWGRGPNNYFLESSYGPVESAYFYYGYKFGIAGLLYYLLLVLGCALIGVNELIRKRPKSFAAAFASWSFITLSAAGVSNSLIDEYKSFFMFFLLFGFVVGTVSASRSEQGRVERVVM